MDFLEILIKKGILNKEDASNIRFNFLTIEEKESNLIERGFKEEDILSAKSEFYGVPAATIPKIISSDILSLIPKESSVKYRIISFDRENNLLRVGMVNPADSNAKSAISFLAFGMNLEFEIFVITSFQFEEATKSYDGLDSQVTEALDELSQENDGVDLDSLVREESSNVNKAVEEAPITKMVATIVRYAVDGRASDIHIERLEDKIRVRFRVDGVLNTSLTLPAKVHSAVVSRIKILANMKLDEKRKPQDGSFSVKVSGRKVDFRVSTFPSYFGEKIVMRILESEDTLRSLEEIGLEGDNLEVIREAIKRPYGIILISGPTGSGKSTTLYSLMKEMDIEGKNILSLEDPVEMTITGVNQSQVRPEIGYTFASGLRTTLRQDPDIIMVGEIRDSETAALAIQAALTGHLVLSTIHTNDSVGVIPRLVDMGVDPYLIAPTLIVAVAQRLARKMCPDSGEPQKIDGSLKMMIENQFSDLPPEYRKKINIPEEVYKISPTPSCPKGTRGRIGVFEILKMDKDIEKAILKDTSSSAIWDIARSKGMLSMKDDALMKAFNRIIPIEEVNKL